MQMVVRLALIGQWMQLIFLVHRMHNPLIHLTLIHQALILHILIPHTPLM